MVAFLTGSTLSSLAGRSSMHRALFWSRGERSLARSWVHFNNQQLQHDSNLQVFLGKPLSSLVSSLVAIQMLPPKTVGCSFVCRQRPPRTNRNPGIPGLFFFFPRRHNLQKFHSAPAPWAILSSTESERSQTEK